MEIMGSTMASTDSVKWIPADGYTKDICDGAILMTTVGGEGTQFVPYDLTVCEYRDGSFVPMHGMVKMPPVKTAEEAQKVLLTYWRNLPNSAKVKWNATASEKPASGASTLSM